MGKRRLTEFLELKGNADTNIKAFERYIKDAGLSGNTVKSYLKTVKAYYAMYPALTKKNLQAYKAWLVDNFKPKTVNVRVNAMNYFLKVFRKTDWELEPVRIQQKPFLENVITAADYEYLKTQLKNDGDLPRYFMVRFLGATGARISEFVKIKCEHVRQGHFDLYSKGGKLRRIYIPDSLRAEALEWMAAQDKVSGFLFVNRFGKQFTREGIAQSLKKLAKKYGIDDKVMYPHSFRHRFAKNFLEKCADITFLADLLGHESIETTRIYLRKTATEQRQLVDAIVDW